MDGSSMQRVRRRRVFYIPGYDPIHPRRYRELYRKDMYFLPFLEVKENTRPTVEVELTGENIRRVALFVPYQPTRDWEIAEFEIYAFGFAPVAEYVSDVVDFGKAASLGPLHTTPREGPASGRDSPR